MFSLSTLGLVLHIPLSSCIADSGLNYGLVVGVPVAVVFGIGSIVSIILYVWCCVLKKKKKKNSLTCHSHLMLVFQLTSCVDVGNNGHEVAVAYATSAASGPPEKYKQPEATKHDEIEAYATTATTQGGQAPTVL